MKRILSIITILTLFVGNVSSQTESQHKFLNPEYTWKYNRVGGLITPWNDVDFSLTPMELKIVGTEQRDGKDYCKLSWTIGEEDPEDLSYFLVREENGAWYAYVEYSDDIKPWNIPIEPGEYLLYDFNLEPGSEFDAPASCSFNFHGMGVDTGVNGGLGKLDMGICHFEVKSKDTDDSGRRVLILTAKFPQDTLPGCPMEELEIVEGVGPLKNGNLAMYFFPDRTTGWRFDPQVDFFEILDQDNQIVYLDPVQRDAGFIDSIDYTWIYGVYDSEGDVSYLRMKTDYYWNYGNSQTSKTTTYRRFRLTSKSESPDGPWEYLDIPCFELREDKGEVWKGSRLIYDYGAADGSELTFYSPEGEQTRRITTGFTEVGGEPRRSYTFDGSDGVTCVEGIGIIKGGILPVVNSEFRLPRADEEVCDGDSFEDQNSYVGAALVAVYDGDGNLIFRQDMPSIVEEIPVSADGHTAPSDRIYDLQGRELRSPIPGQPYIQGGKIHSGRKHE